MRPGRSAALVALLAVAVVAAPSQAAPARVAAAPIPVVTGQVRSMADYIARGLAPEQAAVVRRLDTLAAGGAPMHAVQRRLRADPPDGLCVVVGSPLFLHEYQAYSDLIAVGDLNHDRRPDVVESRSVALSKSKVVWIVNARDAQTGRVLWSRRTDLDSHHVGLVLPVPLTAGRPGVLLITLGATSESVGFAGRISVDQELLALDGRGHDVWQRDDAGEMRYSLTGSTYRHVPLGLQLSSLRKGTTDALVTTYNTEGDGVTGRLTRVAGATGHADTPYPPINSGADPPLGALLAATVGPTDALPFLGVLPDQDGDRLPDIYTARVGTAHLLSAFGGVRGNPLWDDIVLPLQRYVDIRDAGVLTAPELRVHDLALTTESPAGLGLSVSTPATGTIGTGFDALVMLVAGGTGRLQWLQPGGQSYPLQRFGPSLVGALGVASMRENYTPSSYEIHVRLDVYDVSGLQLSSREYVYTGTGKACQAAAFVELLMDMGDLDSDRSLEARLGFTTYDFATGKWHWGQIAVRGVDGATLDRSSAFPLQGSVDGNGDDRASATYNPTALALRALDGRGLHPLWTATVPMADEPTGLEALAVSVTSNRCQDVAVHAYAFPLIGKSYVLTADSIALIASNGKPWWTVAYGRTDLTGRLIPGHGGHPRCAWDLRRQR